MLEAIRDVARRDGPPHRLQGGRRHPPGEAGHTAPRARARDARPRMADAGALPARRLLAAQRHPHAAAQREDRRVPEPGLLHP